MLSLRRHGTFTKKLTSSMLPAKRGKKKTVFINKVFETVFPKTFLTLKKARKPYEQYRLLL